MAHLVGYFHISDRTVQGGQGLKVGATFSWWRWLFPPRPSFIDPGVTSQVRPNKPDEGTDVPSAVSGSDMAVSLVRWSRCLEGQRFNNQVLNQMYTMSKMHGCESM